MSKQKCTMIVNGNTWDWLSPNPSGFVEYLGLLPGFLNADDPDSATQQFNKNYEHGGGWRPIDGYTLEENGVLTYPGDPPMQPLAIASMRNETIIVYRYGIVAVIQPDGSFEACRMD